MSTNDPLENLSAENPRDWQTLINLTELLVAVSRDLPASAISPSIPFLASRLMRLSLDHPLVSAFYKFLAFFFSLARKSDFFISEGERGVDTDKADFLHSCRQFIRFATKKMKGARNQIKRCLNSFSKMWSNVPLLIMSEPIRCGFVYPHVRSGAVHLIF